MESAISVRVVNASVRSEYDNMGYSDRDLANRGGLQGGAMKSIVGKSEQNPRQQIP
jgi:hypothetical protein